MHSYVQWHKKNTLYMYMYIHVHRVTAHQQLNTHLLPLQCIHIICTMWLYIHVHVHVHLHVHCKCTTCICTCLTLWQWHMAWSLRGIILLFWICISSIHTLHMCAYILHTCHRYMLKALRNWSRYNFKFLANNQSSLLIGQNLPQ